MRLIFLLILMPLALNAQQFSFINYSTNAGLPQTQVTDISQDSENYLWLATLGGAARFNGKEFISFSTMDGLLNNKVSSIKCIGRRVFLGHEGGISIIENNKVVEKYTLDLGQENISVSTMVQKDGKVILGTNGFGIYIYENKSIRNLKTSDKLDRIKEIINVNDHYFIATRDGLSHTKDFQQFETVAYFDSLSITSIKAFNEHTLLVCTPNSGVFSYDINTKIVKLLNWSKQIGEVLKYIFIDKQSRIWIISRDGIYQRTQSNTVMMLDEKSGLPTTNFRTIFQDIEGNIWFGSDGKGILKYPEEAFTYYNKKDDLPSDLVMSINKDLYGNLHLGTFDKGLILMNRNEKINIEFDNNLIWSSLLNVDGKNWYGTEFGLVSIQDGKIKYYYEEDGIPGNKITCFYKLSTSSFLIGGSDGLRIYKNGTFQSYADNFDPEGTLRNILKFKDQVYCATDKGLFLLERGKVKKVDRSRSVVYCLALWQNKIYFGTSDGLFNYQPKTDKIERISLSKNPSSSFINFLNATKYGLFIGSNNGVYLLNNEEITHFGTESGLLDLETNLNSSYFDNNNILWFGTALGLIKFDYQKEKGKDIQVKPNVVLENILINYKSFDYTKYATKFNKNGKPQNLELPYRLNNLTFELDGISLSEIKGQRYQYKLAGLDNSWSPLIDNTSITYTSLSAGNYIFYYRAVSQDGQMSEIKSLSFVILAPFYRTWYFYTLMLLIAVVIIILIFQMRIRMERRKNYQEMLEYKSRMIQLEQQSLNASMNRHFIFNSLNSIQYFINTKDKISANKYLSSFAKLIRKNLDSSAETSGMVSLEQELERLELYISLEQMRFSDRFEYKIKTDTSDLDSIMIPSMLLQPFVENSIIHGILPDEELFGTIEIEVSTHDDHVLIILRDNGIGIENSLRLKTNFDGDHKSHGMNITGKRIELFAKMNQENYELIGPRQITDLQGKTLGTEVIIKIPVNKFV